MKQVDLVRKRVLVKLGALPREKQEQRVTEPVFDRFSIVEVVGYDLKSTCDVIIDGKSLGWPGSALRPTDILMKEAETYWYVNLNSIVEVLK